MCNDDGDDDTIQWRNIISLDVPLFFSANIAFIPHILSMLLSTIFIVFSVFGFACVHSISFSHLFAVLGRFRLLSLFYCFADLCLVLLQKLTFFMRRETDDDSNEMIRFR